PYLPWRGGSILVGADDFAAVGGGEGIPGLVAHTALDEVDRAVHEQDVYAAGVIRAGGGYGDGTPPILADVAVVTRGAVGRLGVRVDHGAAEGPPLAFPGPVLVGPTDRDGITRLRELDIGREGIGGQAEFVVDAQAVLGPGRPDGRSFEPFTEDDRVAGAV